MEEICDCGKKAVIVKPMKFSPEDKFSHYRRKARIDAYINRGLL